MASFYCICVRLLIYIQRAHATIYIYSHNFAYRYFRNSQAVGGARWQLATLFDCVVVFGRQIYSSLRTNVLCICTYTHPQVILTRFLILVCSSPELTIACFTSTKPQILPQQHTSRCRWQRCSLWQALKALEHRTIWQQQQHTFEHGR